jgi:hypothetical protein
MDTINSIPIKADQGVEREPDITFDGTNYLVVWSEGDFGSAHKVRAARVSPQGAVLDSGILFGKDEYLEYRPSIASDGNRCLAVWYTYLSPFGVYGRFLNTQAQPDSDAFDIRVTSTGHFFEPDIAYKNGKYLVVWFEQTSTAGDEIFGQIVLPDGTLLGDVIPIAVGPGYQSNPRVCSMDTNFIVVWHIDNNIYGQKVSANGQLIGHNFQISDPTAHSRSFPDIASGSDNCLTVWAQYSNGSYDIYGNLDILTGLYHSGEQPAPSRTIIPTMMFGSYNRFLNDESIILYDITGRKVTSRYLVPGVYFLQRDDRILTKIIKIR